MRWIKKFVRLPGAEKMLLMEAICLLFFSKCLLTLLPFRVCANRLKRKMSDKTADPALLQQIARAVARANRLAFWPNICLVKSFAARLMLQRRKIGSELYLGVQFSNNKELAAHAWLVANGVYLTPKGADNYKELFRV